MNCSTASAWLYDLVVDELRCGEGHGRALVRFLEEWARERGCESIALASPLEETDAHAFYDALEFERRGYVIEREL